MFHSSQTQEKNRKNKSRAGLCRSYLKIPDLKPKGFICLPSEKTFPLRKKKKTCGKFKQDQYIPIEVENIGVKGLVTNEKRPRSYEKIILSGYKGLTTKRKGSESNGKNTALA